jgi:hypothetical protein
MRTFAGAWTEREITQAPLAQIPGGAGRPELQTLSAESLGLDEMAALAGRFPCTGPTACGYATRDRKARLQRAHSAALAANAAMALLNAEVGQIVLARKAKEPRVGK